MKNLNRVFLALLTTTAFSFSSNITTTNQNSNRTDQFNSMDKIFQMQMKQMESMRKQMDAMFNNFEQNYKSSSLSKTPIMIHSSGVLSSGLVDKGNHYELQVKVNNLKNSKIKITTDNGMLTVKVTENKKEEKTNGHYGKIISYANNSSVESFTLPDNADASKIKAIQKDNTILITIPKKTIAKDRAKLVPIEKSTQVKK